MKKITPVEGIEELAKLVLQNVGSVLPMAEAGETR